MAANRLFKSMRPAHTSLCSGAAFRRHRPWELMSASLDMTVARCGSVAPRASRKVGGHGCMPTLVLPAVVLDTRPGVTSLWFWQWRTATCMPCAVRPRANRRAN
eukprot:360491-Chlamydomonas_euryale.AAC.2